jgi:SAM-dependent methyltransferase
MLSSTTIYPGVDVTSADTVIDLGCGQGRVCEIAGSAGAAVIAIDLNEDAVRDVTDRMRNVPAKDFRGIVSSCNPVPVPSSNCTVVVAQEVIQHVENPRAFLQEMVRIGTPDARYVISVPDSVSETIMGIVSPPSYFQSPNHIHVFKRDEFQAMLGDAGLVIEHAAFGGFFWSLWWFFHQSAALPGSPVTSEELTSAWQQTWDMFCRTPKIGEVRNALDMAIPKSQIYICRKAAEK